MTKIYCPICECDTEGSVSVINRDGSQLELYHCDECSENFWRRVERAGGNVTETKAAYITKDMQDNHKATPWLCKSCGVTLGHVHFDQTRLVIVCDHLCLTICGYAIVTCHECGGEQEWIASGEHKLMRRIAKRSIDK